MNISLIIVASVIAISFTLIVCIGFLLNRKDKPDTKLPKIKRYD